MTQLEALQKKFINLRFGTFIHFNSATFQFHNNPDIIRLYKDYLGEPCSEKAEELLHTSYVEDRERFPAK